MKSVDPKIMENKRPIVEMRNISKTFGSTRALKGVDFTVMQGEVHALLGRNGAGKSTLVSTMSGLVASDTGSIRISDTEIAATGQPYAALIRDDIAHVQQTPQLFKAVGSLTGTSPKMWENAVSTKLGGAGRFAGR